MGGEWVEVVKRRERKKEINWIGMDGWMKS